jgi:hypothetical protein
MESYQSPQFTLPQSSHGPWITPTRVLTPIEATRGDRSSSHLPSLVVDLCPTQGCVWAARRWPDSGTPQNGRVGCCCRGAHCRFSPRCRPYPSHELPPVLRLSPTFTISTASMCSCPQSLPGHEDYPHSVRKMKLMSMAGEPII